MRDQLIELEFTADENQVMAQLEFYLTLEIPECITEIEPTDYLADIISGLQSLLEAQETPVEEVIAVPQEDESL